MEYFLDGIYRMYFGDPEELLNFKFSGQNKNKSIKILTEKNDNWYHPNRMSGKECLENAVYGDSDIFEKIVMPRIEILGCSESFVQNVNFTQIKKRRKIKTDFGNELDIHKVYQGHFDRAWDATISESIRQQRQFYYIVFDIGGLSNVNVLDSYWTAAVAVKIYQTVLSHGHNCEISVGNCSSVTTIHGDMLSWIVPIKKFNEQLPVNRLAAMANVGFFRSFGFLAKLSCSKEIQYGMGYTDKLTVDRLPINIRESACKGEINPIIIQRSTNLQDAKRSFETFFTFMQKSVSLL